MPTQEQQQDILNYLDKYTPYIANRILNTGLELDEVKQEIALTLVEVASRRQDLPGALIQTIAQRHIILMLKRRTWKPLDAFSIDAPISSDSDTVLAETLSTPLDESCHPQWRTRDLYSALHRVSLDEQVELKQHFDLEDFHPWSSRNPKKERSHRAKMITGLRALRQDEFLREVAV
jgi:hypothetical protein